jgi:nucleoside 2-deoxyribosyltransferase
VGLYSDSSDIDAITGDIKKLISIGICGSFTEVNKPILDGLKNYLKENLYVNVFTADDFPCQQQQISNGNAKYGYTYAKCMEMIKDCDIVIIFLLNSDQDPEVNQSAIAEIQESCSRQKQNVIILTEKGFRIRSLLKGIKYRSKKWWNWWEFSIDEIIDCHIYVKQTCHNLILERFVRRDR